MISQNSITAQNLQCYHCDVNGLKSTEIRQKCLEDKDDFGELKQCPLSDHICAKGELGKIWMIIYRMRLFICINSLSQPCYKCRSIFRTEFEGNPVTFRRCQMAKGKAGTCEENEIMGMKARTCFCNTDSCNSSRNLYACIFTLLSSISCAFMITIFTQRSHC